MGAGKSTVLRLLRDLGAITVSADEIVHQALDEPEVIGQIVRLFGSKVLDEKGRVDRKALAAEIFSSDEKRGALEGLLHPLVYRRIRQIHQKSPGRIVVAEIPLLIETSAQDQVDLILVVSCSPEVSRARLIERGMGPEEIDRRFACQLPREEKERIADYIIENSGDERRLEEQVKRFWDLVTRGEIRSRSGKGGDEPQSVPPPR
jgi:dephospho-CoA kinase